MKDTLYVTDLDGTLLNTDACLSDKTKLIINNLISEGMNFSYATARSWKSASRIMSDLRLSLPVVTYNGSFIVEPRTGEIIHACVFDDFQRDFIIDTLSSLNLSPLVYSLINGFEKVLWIRGRENDGINNYLASRVGDERLMSVDNYGEFKMGSVFYVTIIGSKDELSFLKSIFSDKSQFTYNYQSDTYNTNEYWFELYPFDAGKAEGVKRLQQMLGLNKLVCFGDNINDVSMFEVSDECYAVANAKNELKKIATGIIDANNYDGVAVWLMDNYLK